MADLDWQILLPDGFEIVKHGGTVSGDPLPSPEPAVWTVARFLYGLTGGIHPFYYLPQLSRARGLAHSSKSYIVGEPSSEWGIPMPADGNSWHRDLQYTEPSALKRAMRPKGEERKGNATRGSSEPEPEIGWTPVGGIGDTIQIRSSTEDLVEERGERGTELNSLAFAQGVAGVPPRPEEDGKQAAAQQRRSWALEGVRSLKIDLQQSGQAA
ncbi:MAG: hypothetical protein KJ749_12435, partial [Planctomycetes bacterium]|nr:hypothetical protein [Planctomycetota bacterium]